MDPKTYSKQFNDESSYLFCHQVSYILETGIIRFLLNILLNANFSVKLWEKKKILDNLNCQIKLNTMNILLGVSGSGKSTLLKAFSNKTGTLPPNYHGELFLPKSFLEHRGTKPKPIYLVYISQKDFFHEMFTIRELLEMVFELKYANEELRDRVLDAAMISQAERQNVDKQTVKRKLVQLLIDEMDLRESANTKIKFCSGGEKKRLSIAVELIALPDILLLDEPTTGLDSFMSLKIIGLLDRFIQSRNMTIVAVLHQPSFDLFNKFGNVIVQDKNGQNLFNGPPAKLVTYLANFGLVCPENYNPADFVLDVANGDFDNMQVREKLVAFQKGRHEFMMQKQVLKAIGGEPKIEPDQKEARQTVDLNEAFYSLPKVVLRTTAFSWPHLAVLTYESYKIQLTDPLNLYLKAMVYVMNLAAFHIGFGMQNGKYDGCPNQNLTKEFLPSNLAEVLAFNKQQGDAVMATSGNVYLTVYIACYSTAALPAILIPNELKIFIRQLNNQWYSFGSYYLSRMLADISIIIIFAIFYGTLNVLLTGITVNFERFAYLMITYIVLCIFIHSAAYLVGGVFIDSANASIYIILVGSIPIAMICDRTKLVTENTSFIVKALIEFSFVKYTFRAMALALYDGRCDESHKATFVNYTIDIRDWLNERLKVKTADDDPDFQGSGTTEAFTNNLVRLINGEYFNKNNKQNPYELRSMVLNKLEFGDYNMMNQWLALLIEIIVVRILSVMITDFLIRKRTF